MILSLLKVENDTLDTNLSHDVCGDEIWHALHGYPDREYVTIVLYIILLVTTICGNILVIAAFCTDNTLQAISNYWIVSLSLTDIVLASTVLPLQVHYLNRTLIDSCCCSLSNYGRHVGHWVLLAVIYSSCLMCCRARVVFTI